MMKQLPRGYAVLAPVDRQTRAKQLNIPLGASDNRAGKASSGGHSSRAGRRSQQGRAMGKELVSLSIHHQQP